MQTTRLKPRRAPLGFTLIELLVVITIIAVLASILLSEFGVMGQKSNEVITLNNMRQFGTATMLYAGDNSYQLPGRVTEQGADKWPALLHPYIPDTRAYSSPVPDTHGKTYKVTDPTLLVSNATNYTSYIINGFNDINNYTGTASPRLNSIALPSETIVFGIPYPQANNFYMDFAEDNEDGVLNLTAFQSTSIYSFADGSARALTYTSTDNMNVAPKNGGAYTHWLWLVNKSMTNIIQPPNH